MSPVSLHISTPYIFGKECLVVLKSKKNLNLCKKHKNFLKENRPQAVIRAKLEVIISIVNRIRE